MRFILVRLAFFANPLTENLKQENNDVFCGRRNADKMPANSSFCSEMLLAQGSDNYSNTKSTADVSTVRCYKTDKCAKENSLQHSPLRRTETALVGASVYNPDMQRKKKKNKINDCRLT